MNILYVMPSGAVHSGLLEEVEGAVTLRARGGRVLPPGAVLALLVPPQPTEDERAILHQAAEAGYQLERP